MGSASRSAFIISVFMSAAFGDELLHDYNGDVVPYDPSVGWLIANPCEDACHESIEDGSFTLRWDDNQSDTARYTLRVSEFPDSPPATLWAEWHYRSNHPQGPFFPGCDGQVSVQYRQIGSALQPTGDGAVVFVVGGGDKRTCARAVPRFSVRKHRWHQSTLVRGWQGLR